MLRPHCTQIKLEVQEAGLGSVIYLINNFTTSVNLTIPLMMSFSVLQYKQISVRTTTGRLFFPSAVICIWQYASVPGPPCAFVERLNSGVAQNRIGISDVTDVTLTEFKKG